MDSINLWNLPELSRYSKLFTKISHEGIYSFGGIDQGNEALLKKPKANNDMRFMPVGEGPTGWKVLDVSGKPPQPRYFMSLERFEQSNMLVVYGGRAEPQVNQESSSFNDVWLMTLKNPQWHHLN